MSEHVKRMLLHAIAAVSVMLVITGTAMADDDMERVRELRGTESILPLSDILTTAAKQYPGKVLEVELEEEHGQIIYEVKLLGRDHKVHHLEIDARSGRILRKGDH